MIGKNTIVMNQATLNRAVEHYLNGVVLQDGVTVTDVTSSVEYVQNQSVTLFKVSIEPSPDALGVDPDEVVEIKPRGRALVDEEVAKP